MEVTKVRDIKIDLLRLFAISSVVLCHATEAIYSFDLTSINALSVQSQIFAFSALTAGRLGVPIFIFITGYLLLIRDWNEENIKLFYKNNLVSLLVTTEIWIVIYDIFLTVINDAKFSLSIFIKNILFLEQVRMGHMWYMSMILGLYLFLPFVSRAIRNLSIHIITPPYILSIICITIVPFMSITLNILGYNAIQSILFLDYSGGAYGIILVSGYLYRKFYSETKFNFKYLTVVAIFSFIALALLQYFSFKNGIAYTVWYNIFPLLICSLIIILLFLKKTNLSCRLYCSLISNLGKCAFGVYLIHFPVILILNKYLVLSQVKPIQVVIFFALTIILSFIIALGISSIAGLRKYILYIK